jgi:hypothetical protein
MAVYNTEFRDEAAASLYPLAAEVGQSPFPTQLFLDMAMYVPSTFEPPFFIQSIERAPNDSARITIADNRSAVVGVAVCNYQTLVDTASIYTEYGRTVGMIVYDREYLERLQGDLQSGDLTFTSTQTQLASEVVRYYKPKGTLNAVTRNYSVHNNVNIVFGGGLTMDDDGGVSMYGEEDSQETQLLTVNGRGGEHVLLMAHVFKDYETESALRLETESSAINVGKSRDFN